MLFQEKQPLKKPAGKQPAGKKVTISSVVLVFL
jgi:hypothetical protein